MKIESKLQLDHRFITRAQLSKNGSRKDATYVISAQTPFIWLAEQTPVWS